MTTIIKSDTNKIYLTDSNDERKLKLSDITKKFTGQLLRNLIDKMPIIKNNTISNTTHSDTNIA